MKNQIAIADAQLPEVYEQAKHALATCEQVDECKDWADKAAALRSYAKQAEDTSLMNHAQRIQARAVRRAGELLEALESAQGRRTDIQPSEGAHTRSQVAERAGMSKHQQVQATRIARVPESDFEAQVESAAPPTITALAEQGKKAHVAHNSGENEWYTPPDIIESAREVMGGIDLDPASSEIANETVKALRYFTAEDDGLRQDWSGRVWLNPPYAQPLITEFLQKLLAEKDRITACVLVNNATETAWGQALLDASTAVCFPKGRIRFIDKKGNPRGAPLQGQMIIYIGPNSETFTNAFSSYGVVFVK